MARVAAAAVFAAGASLAVVGTASASGSEKTSVETQEDPATLGGVSEGQDGGLIGGLVGGLIGGGDSDGDPEGAVGGEDPEGAVGGEDPEGAVGGEDPEGAVGGEDPEGAVGGEDPEGAVGGEDPEGAVGGEDPEGAVGGEDPEGAVGGEDPEGAVGGDDEGGATTDGVAEGGAGPQPDSAGATSPIEQNDPSEQLTEAEAEATTGGNGELAETGASMNETLLIIGAATMIAGGVAFRYLPRLINKEGGAAAA
ncbi:hypothetical protein [Streptomyces hainanensis]|nr:hypothetical protein [Streptomyces hainanensis]